MKAKCLVCGEEIEFVRTKGNVRHSIACPKCKEEYVYGLRAINAFYTYDEQLLQFRREGMPHVCVNRTYYYPIGLGQKWFRGEDIESEAV